jgi:YfiH family protein
LTVGPDRSDGGAQRGRRSVDPDPDWRVEERDGVRLVRCGPINRIAGVQHAFSTRGAEGDERFDLGGPDEETPAVARRRRAFMLASGLGRRRPIVLRQVHGATVVDADEVPRGAARAEADGVVAIADESRLWAPAVRWADCVPVLLAARDGRGVAAVHSGWRGTVARVVPEAIARLRERGVAPGELVAGLGPAIGDCCYEVGEEVATAVACAAGAGPDRVSRRSEGRTTLDLRRAIRIQLERAGLRRGAIHVAPWCTACAADLFFSYRREGAAAGRQMACIGWPAGGPP